MAKVTTVAGKFAQHALKLPSGATVTSYGTVASVTGLAPATQQVYALENVCRATYMLALLPHSAVWQTRLQGYTTKVQANAALAAHLPAVQALAAQVAQGLQGGQVVANPGSLPPTAAGPANAGALQWQGNHMRKVY